MADANEMLQEARHAFHNVGSGSVDSEKNARKAKSLAHRIIRKYPHSREANSARSILEQLGEQAPPVATRPAPVIDERVGTEKRGRTTISGGQFSALVNKYCLPGWAFRLLQTIPVLVGLNLLLPTLFYFSFARMNATSLMTLAAGGLLVSLPWLGVFDRLVDYTKTKIFSEKDWDRDVIHLPTPQDRYELIEAFKDGNTAKRIGMAVGLFVLSSYLVIFGAIIYVIGTRKALDDIEGWLLDRKLLTSAVVASALFIAEKGTETIPETEEALTREELDDASETFADQGDASDTFDDQEARLADSTDYGASGSGGFLTIVILIVGFIVLVAILYFLPMIIALLQIIPFLIVMAPLLLVLGIIKP